MPPCRRWAASLLVAGCTTSAPGASQQALPRPVAAPFTAAALPRSAVLVDPDEALVQVRPVDGERALLLQVRGERITDISLLRWPSQPLWTYTFGPAESLPRWLAGRESDALVIAGDTVVAALSDGERHGFVGLALATGARRWLAHPEVRVGHEHLRMFAGVVDDRVVHALAGDAATHVVARAAATGAVTESVTNVWTERRSDWPQFGATTVTHLDFDPAEPPDDPDLAGARWVARRGIDLTPLITLDTVVDAPPCLVGDHLYAAGTDGLLRVALDRPVPSLTLLHPEPRAPIACDRYRDVDVVWLPGHVLGVTDDGAPAWFVDLDGWVLAGHERRSEVLPDRPLVFVGRPPREQRLLLLDLREHRVVGAVDVADFVARVHHDPRRSFVGLAARRPGQAWLMSTFDGSTGAPGGAVFVDAAPPLSFHVLGDTLWLTGDGPAAARLDPSTLQPRDAQPALGLRDASEWLAARWPAVLAPPRAGPPGEPQGPPRFVRPLLDRDPGPMPRWAREPLDAATRALAHADATRPVWLLAWDIQESSEGERSHHALVALELADARGGPRWLVALMQRRFASELAERSPESAAPWSVLETSRWPRRLIVTRRPTGADLERLLVGSSVWTAASYAGSRLLIDGWFVDGNVIDAAWHELTGEAPRWSYPAPLERPE